MRKRNFVMEFYPSLENGFSLVELLKLIKSYQGFSFNHRKIPDREKREVRKPNLY